MGAQTKAMKNVRGKNHLEQRKILSKITKGKQQLKQLPANLKLPTTMTQANLKFVMGRLMLTVNAIKLAGKSYVELHNYYINNYHKGQDMIVSYKD
jgi:hypothetical protein